MGGPQGRWLRLMPSRSTEISTELGLRGKRAIITGASSGIGLAIASEPATEGAPVATGQTEPAAGLTLRMEREEGTT